MTPVRVIGNARIDGTHRKFNDVDEAGSSLEVYSCGEGRYVTVTGREVDGCWPHLSDITDLAQRLVRDQGRLHAAQAEMPEGEPPKAEKPFEPSPGYKPGRFAEAFGFTNGYGRRSQDGLVHLIAQGAPEGQRSEQFHNSVGWAKRIGWTPERLEQVMRQHPTGIASKYLSPNRLTVEIARCWGKMNDTDFDRMREEAARARAGRAESNNHGAGESGASGGQGNAGGDTGSGATGPETSQGTEAGQGAAGNAAPEPKPAPLWNPWREYSAPEFPLDVLPLDVRQYVEARATETGACLSAIAMSCLATMSGAITHEVKLHLKHSKNFSVGPRLWVMLVGNPSSKKSPAMDGAVRPLVTWQKAEHVAALKAWEEEVKALPKKEQKDHPRPNLTYYTMNDLTPEALVDILSRQNRGTLVVADELAGWLGSLDRYGSGKGASASRGIWLTAYNGSPYSLHRIGRHTRPVDNLSVSLLGGIQMERLRELGDLTSDGLLQRFLPVMMRASRLDSDSFNGSAYLHWDQRLRELIEIGAVSIELSPEAKAERERIAVLIHNLGAGESEGPGWQGFVGKLMGVWGSLALIMHAIWEPQIAFNLKVENAKRATKLIEGFVLPHGLAFYRAVGGTAQANARAIGAYLAEWENDTISARDLGLGPRCFRKKTAEKIVEMLAPFETGGWVVPEKPGMLNRNWAITPGLATRFAEGVASHKEAVALIQAKIVGDFDDE